uniref:Uncharacterized protein n=1 Tax=Cannabis sativa TaxID=3483 RepID=A0A803PHP8_CANSA
MAKELAKTKLKLAAQEKFSHQMQETLARLKAEFEPENVVSDEDISYDPTPQDNNTTKRMDLKDLRAFDPNKGEGKGVMREPPRKTAPTAPHNNTNDVGQPLHKKKVANAPG